MSVHIITNKYVNAKMLASSNPFELFVNTGDMNKLRAVQERHLNVKFYWEIVNLRRILF